MKRSTIESLEVRNRKNNASEWIIDILHCHDWVSMQPSVKGAFRVSARDALDLKKHWKGRILAFRQRLIGSHYVNEALVQHVFLHKDICVHPNVKVQRYMPNMIYPSDSIEWQSAECFTGILQVFHTDIGPWGENWSCKTSSDLEMIECHISSKDVVFRYFIGRQTLCLAFKYQRWRMLNGKWNSIDQDTRDSTSIELSLVFEGREPFTLQIEDDWPLSNIRQEITFAMPNPPANFFFQLDGRKIRSRNENGIVGGQCMAPHILKVLESP